MKSYSVTITAFLFIIVTGCTSFHQFQDSMPIANNKPSSDQSGTNTSDKHTVTLNYDHTISAITDASLSFEDADTLIESDTEFFHYELYEDIDTEDTLQADNIQDYEYDNLAMEDELSNEFDNFNTTQRIIDEALELCQSAQHYWQEGEPDNAIEALDSAYSLILQVDTNSEQKAVQQLDDIRFLISKRILEIYASRNTVVPGGYNEIPIIMNDHVRQEVRLFTETAQRNFFIRTYQRSGKYRPMIVQHLEDAGLPTELSWLPFIESGYKVNALSPARALGLWQFIPSTGYKFGLNRTKYLDERMDPEKSTKAAIAYLKVLHQLFGDWSTVLAAYNCGEGRVLRVIRAQNVNYLDDFWDLYTRLPRETARYVPKFMAVLHILENKEKYGFTDEEMRLDQPLEYDTVSVSKQLSLEDIANTLNIEFSLLKELNAELRYSIIPSGDYELKLPKGKTELFIAKLDSITAPKPSAMPRAHSNVSVIHHRVRSGDTLSTIAKRYGTSVQAIKGLNRIPRNNLIVAGEVLRIPSTRNTTGNPTAVQSRTASVNTKNYTVKRGDSLWIIANRHNTDVNQLMALNGLRRSVISVGQVLKVPNNTKTSPLALRSKGSLRYHSVRDGDIPQAIAKRYNMPLDRLLQINNLSPNSIIYPGQKLYID